MAARILHVMKSLERSGMEMMLLNSAQEWEARGIRADLVATAPTVGPMADELAKAGYRIFHIPFRSRVRYLPHRHLAPDFWRLCKTGGYDLLHIHTEAATTLFAALARSAGIPKIVLTVHNTFRFRGILRARKYIERRLTRMIGGKYGMVSNAVLDCEWERFRNRGVRIYNWLNTSHFRPPSAGERQAARLELDCPTDAFILSTVGNCDGGKNHSALIQALARVKEETPVCLLHVGREEPGQPERALATDLHLEQSIRFFGSQPDPRAYLWAADAFVMPSLQEGLGIAALEAIAAGTPTVLTNVSGLDEIASHTRWAMVGEPNPLSLADAILKLIRVSRETRLARALADSVDIREQFSEDKGVTRLISILYELPNIAH
jgi:glycosyltransferase involved in cell wall biosynthesis